MNRERLSWPVGDNTFRGDRFDYRPLTDDEREAVKSLFHAPPARSVPSRLSWLLSVVVTAATLATLDWAAARWTTTATVPLGFPGGPRIDVQTKRSHLGLWEQKRTQASTGRLERP